MYSITNSTRQLSDSLFQLWLAGLALSLIGAALGLYVLYLVIRWGVRDGMRDASAGLRAERRSAVKHDTTGLPDMRAD